MAKVKWNTKVEHDDGYQWLAGSYNKQEVAIHNYPDERGVLYGKIGTPLTNEACSVEEAKALAEKLITCPLMNSVRKKASYCSKTPSPSSAKSKTLT
jgi:hypothetical protein